jgi:hypothetical protein
LGKLDQSSQAGTKSLIAIDLINSAALLLIGKGKIFTIKNEVIGLKC